MNILSWEYRDWEKKGEGSWAGGNPEGEPAEPGDSLLEGRLRGMANRDLT
jgi:hypothetical protein